MAAICPVCGNEVADHVRFCFECGNPMQEVSAMQQTYTQQQAAPAMQQTYTQQQAAPAVQQTYMQQQAAPAMQQTYTQQHAPAVQQTYTPQRRQSSYEPQSARSYQQESYQRAERRPARNKLRRDKNGYALAGPESSTLMRILSYLGILWLVPFFAARDDRGARYHCNQGLTLFIVSLVFSIVGGVGSAIGGIVGVLIGVIVAVGSIFTFVLMIIGIINAMKGVLKPLPVIGGIRVLG